MSKDLDSLKTNIQVLNQKNKEIWSLMQAATKLLEDNTIQKKLNDIKFQDQSGKSGSERLDNIIYMYLSKNLEKDDSGYKCINNTINDLFFHISGKPGNSKYSEDVGEILKEYGEIQDHYEVFTNLIKDIS